MTAFVMAASTYCNALGRAWAGVREGILVSKPDTARKEESDA